MMEYYEDLLAILRDGAGSKIDRASAVFQIIQQAPTKDRAAMLRTTCETWDSIEGNNVNGSLPLESMITDSELEVLKKQYGKMVDSFLEGIISANPSEEVFYQQLWDVLSNSILLTDPKAQYFALYWVLVDSRIPYFFFGEGLSMSDEQFKLVNRRLYLQRARIRFATKRSFDQKTQRASVLLQELDSVSGEDRVVLMANLIDYLQADKNFGKLLGGLSHLLGSGSSD